MNTTKKQRTKSADSRSNSNRTREQERRRRVAELTDANLEALAEDCEREMYGDDYEALKWSGWLDR